MRTLEYKHLHVPTHIFKHKIQALFFDRRKWENCFLCCKLFLEAVSGVTRSSNKILQQYGKWTQLSVPYGEPSPRPTSSARQHANAASFLSLLGHAIKQCFGQRSGCNSVTQMSLKNTPNISHFNSFSLLI